MAISFQQLLAASSVSKATLGGLYTDPHGNTWQYGQDSGSASTSGFLQAPAAAVAVDTVSSSTNGQGLIVFITDNASSFTAGAHNDDYVLVDEGTGAGQVARIKTNSATTLELYEEYALGTALSVADSDVTVVRPYKLRTAPTGVLGDASGVVQCTQTASYYVWTLKNGVGRGVINGGTVATASNLSPSAATAGELDAVAGAATSDDQVIIGRLIIGPTADDTGGIVRYAV